MVQTLILYGAAALLLLLSFRKDRKKTVMSLKGAKTMGISTVPEIVGLLGIVSLVLTVLPPEAIRSALGNESSTLSTLIGAAIGTVTIIPAFIAFPLSKQLIASGAHLMAVAAFITTLTMVGFATMPLEISHFGRRFTILRNLYSFIAAILIALLMGVIL